MMDSASFFFSFFFSLLVFAGVKCVLLRLSVGRVDFMSSCEISGERRVTWV